MPARNLWDTVLGNVGVNLPASISGTPPTLVGFNNLTATTDPTSSNDQTQGYSVGSLWLNTAAGALRVWSCRSAATGAAAWVFEGADFSNGGSNPSTEATQFGSGTALMAAEGNINRQVNGGTAVGGTGADIVMATFVLPALTFDISGRGIQITAMGTVLGGDNKTVKLIFNPSTAVLNGTVGAGGITIATSGVISTANGSGWCLSAAVFKYGVLASNTQIGLHQQAQNAGSVGPLLAPQLITAIEALPINVCLTGNAATLPGDIVWSFFEINALN